MTTLAVAIICAFTWKLPIICPKGWANSKFKVSGPVMTAIVIFSTACAVFNIWLNSDPAVQWTYYWKRSTSDHLHYFRTGTYEPC